MILIAEKQDVVYPSAGHHDADQGASGNGYKEADVTKLIRNLMIAEFNRRNHKIIVDKDWETNTQYQRRIKPGNGSVIMDLHLNAATPSASGIEVYVNNNASKESIALATEICAELSKIMNIPNRGVKLEINSPRKRIGILNLKAGISVLVELCFITNKRDIEALLANKEAVAKKLVDLAIKYDNMIV